MQIYRSNDGRVIFKIILGVAVAVIAVMLILFLAGFFSDEDLDDAIAQFEDGDYVEAIEILNSLARRETYDRGELIYYYRCKSVNRLAERQERRFSGELKIIADPLTEKDRKEREKRYVEDRLLSLNEKIQGDIRLVTGSGFAKITPGGRFYDDFISRYKGSRYIEDLDFEEMENVERTDPARLMDAAANFYAKYPRTSYLAQMVRMLFGSLEKTGGLPSGRDEMLKRLIIDYGRRYPTSSEIHRIFTCKGDDVNLRNAPGVQGKIVGKVKRDEILIQIEKSMDSVQIGDVRDYWYRMVNLSGLQGWIFGKFLAPVDIAQYGGAESAESWSLEDNFAEWSDSNTPKSWIHVEGGDTAAIQFYEKDGKRLARLTCPAERKAGLYRRMPGTRAFTVLARGRLVSGDSMILIAYSMSGGTFYVKLNRDEMDVCGRIIPLGTYDWREYRLTSDDGKYAAIHVDGELISSRIPPVQSADFPHTGIYCLMSSQGKISSGELEFVKYR